MGRKISTKRIERLIKELSSKDDEIRHNATSEISLLGEKAKDLIPTLIKIVKKDACVEVRWSAIWALGEMGEKAVDAIPVLIETIKNDQEPAIRFRAALTLGFIARLSKNEAIAVPALVESLKNDVHKGVRINVVIALGDFGNNAKKAISEIKHQLSKKQDSDYEFELAYNLVRIEGIKSIGTKRLQEMKEKGMLGKRQIYEFDLLLQQLNIQKKVEQFAQSVHNSQFEIKATKEEIEQKKDSKEKSELLKIIKNQEHMIERLQEEIKQLKEEINQFYKHQHRLDYLVKQYVDKPISDLERIELLQKFDSISKAVDSNEKGKALEEFCQLFFSKASGLRIVDINANYVNEELDIFIQNNINKPYWYHFSSPNIFVECKNWTRKVGKNEIVLFKNKIENHQNIVKIGFLIAMNGFTKGVTIEQIRNQIKGYTIGLIEKKDFKEFFNSSLTILEFMEKIIQKKSIR